MVGGIVKNVRLESSGNYLLTIQDRFSEDTCQIRCESVRVVDMKAIEIRTGDSIWWQSGFVMWTPQGVSRQDKGRADIRIRRRDYLN